MLRGGVGFYGVRNPQLQGVINKFPPGNILPVHEGHGGALIAGAPSAPGTVQVGFLVLRHTVVNHMGHIFHINTAGGNVGCHQNIDFAVAEGTQRLLTRTLVEVAVQGSGGEPARNQLIGNPRRIPFGFGENDGAPTPLCTQDTAQHLVFIHMVHPVHHLPD